MSSRRKLKKSIRYTCGDIAVECIIARDVVPHIDKNVMNDIVIKVARLQSATLAKISFGFDKISGDYENDAVYNKARHDYMGKAFKSLKIEFNKQIKEIVKEMNAALPQEQKNLNKTSK